MTTFEIYLSADIWAFVTHTAQ